MDEKTARLRDIFVELAGGGTVTERQQESRGSLAGDAAVDDRLRSVISRMQDRYDFRTSLSDDELVVVVRGFYAGDSDTEVARKLGDASRAKTVSRARIDLHLVTERDLDAPFDLDTLQTLLKEGQSTAEIADELDVSESTVRRYRGIVEVQAERRAVGDRFREEFEWILGERGLGERLTGEIRQTGLEDATEGMESNVSF